MAILTLLGMALSFAVLLIGVVVGLAYAGRAPRWRAPALFSLALAGLYGFWVLGGYVL